MPTLVEEISNTPPTVSCTIGNLFDTYELLNTLAHEKLDPAKSAKIYRLIKWVEPYYEEINALRMLTATRLGTPLPAPDEGKYGIPPENIKEFNTVVLTATKKPVSVPDRLKISVVDLNDIKVSPHTLARLCWVLNDLIDS